MHDGEKFVVADFLISLTVIGKLSLHCLLE
jgi:hypothetical protein